MIHGWALDHRIFDAQVAGLRNDLLVLRYDRRGFGRSDAPPDLAREVDDIDALLDAMGLESAHVLGMSQGGRIALRYAVTRPARVRSLILQGAAVDGFNADEDESERIPVQEYADLAKRGNLHEVRHRWLRHPMMRLDARFSNEAILLRKIVFEPGGYAYPIDVSSALPRFHRPVLLITGATESVNRKRHAAELLSRLPAANDYNNAVREFCRTVESHSG
jgi:pimeloyl-ACP methyl ester carboxylesterase